MALSEWPEHFRRDDFDEPDYVTVDFETPMFVLVETDLSFGLADSMDDRVSLWIPKSQLDGTLEVEDELDEIVVTRWLAEQKGLL